MGVILPPEPEARIIDSYSKDNSAEGQAHFRHEIDYYARKVGPEGMKEVTAHLSDDAAQKVLHELELLHDFDSKEINQAAKGNKTNELLDYASQSSEKYLGTLELTDEGKAKMDKAKHETNTQDRVMYGAPPDAQEQKR